MLHQVTGDTNASLKDASGLKTGGGNLNGFRKSPLTNFQSNASRLSSYSEHRDGNMRPIQYLNLTLDAKFTTIAEERK